MRYRELTEAPLASYELHGDWSDDKSSQGPINLDVTSKQARERMKTNSFISKVDRALAQNPEIQARLERIFAKHNIDLYLYMINSPEMSVFMMGDNLDYGKLSRYSKKWELFSEDFATKLLERAREKSVQVILTHNEGGSIRHALTPWIIVHRMGHALAKFGNFSNIYDKLWMGLDAILSDCYGVERGHSYRFHTSNLIRTMCTFRSARESRLIGATNLELTVELFTQYIVNGAVKLHPLPLILKATPQYSNKKYRCSNINHMNEIVLETERKCNNIFDNLLVRCQGGIFIC